MKPNINALYIHNNAIPMLMQQTNENKKKQSPYIRRVNTTLLSRSLIHCRPNYITAQLLGAENARSLLLPTPITNASSPCSASPKARLLLLLAWPPHAPSSASSIIHREKPSAICSAAAYSPRRQRRVWASTNRCHSKVHLSRISGRGEVYESS